MGTVRVFPLSLPLALLIALVLVVGSSTGATLSGFFLRLYSARFLYIAARPNRLTPPGRVVLRFEGAMTACLLHRREEDGPVEWFGRGGEGRNKVWRDMIEGMGGRKGRGTEGGAM